MVLKSLCDLDTPFILELGHAQQADAHDGDDYGGDETEHAFPDVLSVTKDILSEAIESADEGATNGQADEQAACYPKPDLSEQPFVHHRISLRPPNALLEECQQDGNNDGAFEAFSEADEEDCPGQQLLERRQVQRPAHLELQTRLTPWRRYCCTTAVQRKACLRSERRLHHPGMNIKIKLIR